MNKQTYIASGLTADQRGLANLPTQKLMQVIDFMEQSGMPISVALGHEEPPRDPSSVPRWSELVYKLSPKMYKFLEWYMKHSAKGVESLGILTRLEDFATEGERVVWLQFKDINQVYHLEDLNTDLIITSYL
jgi:hypothetical protein